MDQISDIKQFLAERRRSFLSRLRTEGLDLPSADLLRYSVKDLGSVLAYDHDQPEDDVDESTLSITRTITTPATDRYGDVVLPRGCEASISKYLGNPQVFFGHKSFDLPVARTVKLEITEERIRAVAQFHEETDEARTVWRLCSKGLLPGSSIGFLPVKASIIGSNKDDEVLAAERAKKRKEKTPEGEKILTFDPWMALRFLEWELLEWSVVSVPANPECVDGLTKALSDGVIEGQAIPLSISKSLAPFALKAKIWSPGFDPIKAGYSGTLLLGEEEMEFEAGVLKRLGEMSLVEASPPEELPAADPVTVYEPAPAERSTEPASVPVPEPQVKEAETTDPILEELKRHHAVEEAHMAQEAQFQAQVLAHLEGLCTHEAEEPKAAPVPETRVEDSWAPVLQALKAVAEGQKKLSDKFFEVTGARV